MINLFPPINCGKSFNQLKAPNHVNVYLETTLVLNSGFDMCSLSDL